MAKLTAKQAAFCREYMIDRNATQAAIRAGYSAKTAGAIGDENLKKPEISEEITKLEKQHAEAVGVTVQDVIGGFLKEAKNPEARPQERINAWDKIGKHLGIYEADNKQKGDPRADLDEKLLDLLSKMAK